MSGTRKTFCLRIVVDVLTAQNITYRNWSPQTGLLVESGVMADIAPDFTISIQTHPIITGEAFTETALHYQNAVVYTENWFYYDVRRQYSPQELTAHLLDMRSLLDGYTYNAAKNSICLANGQEIHFLPR